MPNASTTTDRQYPTDYLQQWCILGDEKAEQVSQFLRRPPCLDICESGWAISDLQEVCECHFAALYRHKVIAIVGHVDVKCSYRAAEIEEHLKTFEYLRSCVAALIVCTIAPDPGHSKTEMAKIAAVNKFITNYPTTVSPARPATVECLDLIPIFVNYARGLIPSSYSGTHFTETPSAVLPWSNPALEQFFGLFRSVANHLPWRFATASEEETGTDLSESDPPVSPSLPSVMSDQPTPSLLQDLPSVSVKVEDTDSVGTTPSRCATPSSSTSSDDPDGTDPSCPGAKRRRKLSSADRDLRELLRRKKHFRRHSPVTYP